MTKEELLKVGKPILFNSEMVKAILEGRKTVTRRCIKPQPTYSPRDGFSWKGYACGTDLPPTEKGARYNFLCNAPYKVGDILYVRETWNHYVHDIVGGSSKGYHEEGYFYKASPEMKNNLPDFVQYHWGKKWKPSIHMPKEAARIFLKVKDVRVERLQDITEEQTEAEGFQFTPPCLSKVSEDSYCDLDGPCTNKVKYCDMSAGELFGKVLWDSTIKKADIDTYGWDASPWVWVIEFERIEVDQ